MKGRILVKTIWKLFAVQLAVHFIPLVFLGHVPHWANVTSLVLFLAVAANFLVICVWNLTAESRPRVSADDTHVRVTRGGQELSAYDRRPGGVHVTFFNGVRYLPPAITGTGFLSAKPLNICLDHGASLPCPHCHQGWAYHHQRGCTEQRVEGVRLVTAHMSITRADEPCPYEECLDCGTP